MYTKHSLLQLFVVAVSLFITCGFMLPTMHTSVPDGLLIARSPVFDNGAAQEMVDRPQLVQKLYYHTLSLPQAPEHQVCPMYIIAQYQLTFLHNRTSLLKVNVLQGGCGAVTFRSGDKRAADGVFWSLLQQANAVGKQSQSQSGTGASFQSVKQAP